MRVWEVTVALLIPLIIGLAAGAWGSVVVTAGHAIRIERIERTCAGNTRALNALEKDMAYVKGGMDAVLTHFNLPSPGD